jgi:uncharacterized protein (TIGR00369 family)
MSQTQVQNEMRTDISDRAYSWPDPTPVLHAAAQGYSGLELLTAMAQGRLPFPPIGHTLDFDDFAVGEGWTRVGLTPQAFHYNPHGTVHGGVIAALLDTAAACAVQTTLPPFTGYTSVDLNTKFLRPVTIDTGHVTCEGVVISRGKRTALAEARLTDATGRLLAHATTTCMVLAFNQERS